MSGALFMTGATGYLGSYVVDHLLRTRPDVRLVVLVRGRDRGEAAAKLWRALQLHRDADGFREGLARLEIATGDVTLPGLGLDDATRARLLPEVDSILHLAASLNRRSERACLDVNLRGTLEVLRFARDVGSRRRGALRRFGFCSTNAVAGERDREHVHEDEALDWSRRQYDPYARTKAFGEAMVRDFAREAPIAIFRPSIVMGDARHPRTTQFDMVRAAAWLADLPVVPVRPDTRADIVNADWVGRAIAELHLAPELAHDTYHLTAGLGAVTAREIGDAVAAEMGRRRQRFAPRLEEGFGATVRAVRAFPRRNAVTAAASLLEVFWPYITYDTVFDNRRAVEAIGEAPTPFTAYCGPLYRWAKANRFRFPYQELPA